MQARFNAKKHDILHRLAVPDGDYTDASPKGSVDVGVRQLVQDINSTDGFVTTSSCSGRIAVYLEGSRQQAKYVSVDGDHTENDEQRASRGSIGGKGGGKWLFTSHDPVDLKNQQKEGSLYSYLGFDPVGEVGYPYDVATAQFVHLKFEPLILHILSLSLKKAQLCLSAATAAGFRESGISGTMDTAGRPTLPMVAVRGTGQAMDSIVGFLDPASDRIVPMATEAYLMTCLQLANVRFQQNEQRKERFREAFLRVVAGSSTSQGNHAEKYKQDRPLSDKQRRKLERKAEARSASHEIQEGDIYACDLAEDDDPQSAVAAILDSHDAGS